MAVFVLIRHGHTDAVGHRLVGRLPGVLLNARGHAEAQRLAERLGHFPLTHIFASPLERTRQSAAPLARRLGVEVALCDALNEIDFGEWAGRTFEDLDAEPLWRCFNALRSATRIPGGELMVEVQARMVGCVEALRARHPGGMMALVGHGDPLKSLIAHYTGLPLDHMARLELSPASVSLLAFGEDGPKVLCVNSLDPLTPLSPS